MAFNVSRPPMGFGGVTGPRNPMAGPGASGPPAAGGGKPSDNVFVGNLPYEWGEAELNAVVGTCGTIVTSVVLRDRNTGHSKGAGMVRFSSVAEAALAVQTLNGYVADASGRRLQVNFAERPEEKGARLAVKQVTQQLRFSPYGAPGASFGPAALVNGAMAALGQIGMPQVGPMGPGTFGAPITIPKRTDVQPEEGANLHVFGLDMQVTDLHLYQAFAHYGAVRSVRVMVDPATKNPKGFGFVQFYNVQDAQSAMAALNGVQVGSRTWSISVHQKKATA